MGQNDVASNDAMRPIPTTESNTVYDPLFSIENFQWQPQPFSNSNSCPGDLNMNPIDPSLQQLDTIMDYDFSSNQFGTTFSPTRGTYHEFSSENLSSEIYSNQNVFSTPPQTAPTRSSSSGLPDEELPCFRCNPRSDQRINPRIGSEYLQKLEETLNNQSVWTGAEFVRPQLDHSATLHVSPVQGGLRDKLMVISQGFLSRARDVHRTGSEDASSSQSRSSSNASLTGFFILPPPPVLEEFLRTYASRVEPYMSSFSASTIDLATLVTSTDEKSTILLLLLMIAHGAMGNAQPEARFIASGLVEICRISMFDIMEKNVQMAAQPMMLRCALLYLNAAAWSGYKWHMDLSAAHSRMYISMVRHAGLLDTRQSPLLETGLALDAETAWTTWKSKEALNRLAYSWVILDQEMNLFHDRQPDFEIDDCNAPVPYKDELWNATSAESWQAALAEAYQSNPQAADSSRSLAQLFNMFMSNELSSNTQTLLPIELRLLLQPLQALIYHLNKSIHYFFNSGSQRLLQRLLTQLEEVQYLLKQWYTISSQSTVLENPSPNGCTNMVMFHLISLNASTYLPDIEKLARGDISSDTFHDSLWTGKRCVEEAPQIWCHCGQVVRYFRKMPASSRPYWWSAALYRVALCLWAVSLSSNINRTKTSSTSPEAEMITVDALPFDHPSIVRYLRHREGRPGLSHADGTVVSLVSAADVVQQCIEVLSEKTPLSQLDAGIKSRLSTLVERWREQ